MFVLDRKALKLPGAASLPKAHRDHNLSREFGRQVLRALERNPPLDPLLAQADW